MSAGFRAWWRWVQESRLASPFTEDIDAKSVRAAQSPANTDFVPMRPLAAVTGSEPGQLRKI
jgi:hypothetical protein